MLYVCVCSFNDGMDSFEVEGVRSSAVSGKAGDLGRWTTPRDSRRCCLAGSLLFPVLPRGGPASGSGSTDRIVGCGGRGTCRACGVCAEFWASSARNLGRSTVAWCWWRVKGLEQRRPLACFIHRPSDRAAGSRGVVETVETVSGTRFPPPLAGSQKLRRAACKEEEW